MLRWHNGYIHKGVLSIRITLHCKLRVYNMYYVCIHSIYATVFEMAASVSGLCGEQVVGVNDTR
jgi:hypothetical protein